jgi:class 3 adenylate cyclase/tRNA A-37 threonylcarbamoyl transferase component Bud32/tetratricopeptide (TPR) repeat protein
MDADSASQQAIELGEFRRRHLTRLCAFVFTDLVDSVALRRQLGDQASTTLLQSHRQLVRNLLQRVADAEEIETVGDSFLLLFGRPSDAVRFALFMQRQVRALAQEHQVKLADRVGIHLGEVVIEENEQGHKPKDLYGSQVDLCARVMGLARGGQILLTHAVFDSARQALKGEELQNLRELKWLNHGPYLFKGIEEPVEVCEVGEAGEGVLSAPADSEKAHRKVSVEEERVFGWRPAVGQVVPNTKWTLEQKLGEGGFGEVWLGRHEALKEQRVFKFCFRADRVRALKREVTLFRLMKEKVGHHPNIVGIQEMFFDQPPYYIVMDYADGKDLRAWCDEKGGSGKVPLEAKLEIVGQIADALQAAHQAGVIHRDVKPSNILISSLKSEVENPTLQVKLTDFGIGQVVSQEALSGLTQMGFTQTMLSPSSTQTGTHIYMAPELLAGEAATGRSDLYSLGVVLYQLLIGDLSRPLTTDWARKITEPLLREDLDKCFAGDPEERFTKAAELARNLRSLGQRRAELAEREAATARRRLLRQVAAISAALFLVALPIFYVLKHGAAQHKAAMEAFLLGQLASSKGGPTNNLEAITNFQKAVALDDSLAKAWAAMAVECATRLYFWAPEEAEARNWDRRTYTAVQKALLLDTTLADAYFAEGWRLWSPYNHFQHDAAVARLREAVRIDPNDYGPHSWLAVIYGHTGFLEEALAESRLLADIAPPGEPYQSASDYLWEGRYEEALLDWRNAGLDAVPGYCYSQYAWTLFASHREKEASDLLKKFTGTWVDDTGEIAGVKALLLAAADDTRGAEAQIAIASAKKTTFPEFHHTAYFLAAANARLRRPEEAMRWLKVAAGTAFPCYPLFKSDPNLENLRGMAEFESFLSDERKDWERRKKAWFPNASAGATMAR